MHNFAVTIQALLFKRFKKYIQGNSHTVSHKRRERVTQANKIDNNSEKTKCNLRIGAREVKFLLQSVTYNPNGPKCYMHMYRYLY